MLIHKKLKNALVIPQRATFEFLDKQYVWVVGEDDVVQQRLIAIVNELEDMFVVKSGHETKEGIVAAGLEETDRIIFEGVRQVRDGERWRSPSSSSRKRRWRTRKPTRNRPLLAAPAFVPVPARRHCRHRATACRENNPVA